MENEIAFARTQGAFTLPNPLAVVKDEGEYHNIDTHVQNSVYTILILCQSSVMKFDNASTCTVLYRFEEQTSLPHS